MAGSSFANVNKALAVTYDRPFRGKVGWSKGALAGMIRKTQGYGITGPVIPIRSGNSPAVSNTFASAQTIATTQFTKTEQFNPAWVKKYGVAQIDGLLMAAAESDGGLYDKFCVQLDGILDGTMNQFSCDIYRSGFGSIGRVASAAQYAAAGLTVNSTTLLLANPEDIVHWGRGIQFQGASTDGASVLRGAPDTVTVTGILSLQAGTIGLSGALGANIVSGDFLFPLGNRQNSATPTPLAIPGLDAWFPVTAPSTTDFTGANRSADALLLGTIIDTTTGGGVGLNKEDCAIEAITASARYGGNPEEMVYFTNPTNYKQLITTGMSKFRPTQVSGPYNVGFRGATIETNNGEIKVIYDKYCPVQRSYLIDMSTLKFYGCGSPEVPRFINADGVGNVLRMTSEDSVESRVGFYGVTGCNNPVVNVVVNHSNT